MGWWDNLIDWWKPDNEPEPTPKPNNPLANRKEIVHRLFELHAEKNPGVKRNKFLNKAAQGHANWMANNERMSHTGSGGSSFWSRIQAAGYKPSAGAENVAAGQTSADAVFSAWMWSFGHRRNINGDYDEIGLGVAQDDDGDLYWCVVFGSSNSYGFMMNYDSDDYCPPGLDIRSEFKKNKHTAPMFLTDEL